IKQAPEIIRPTPGINATAPITALRIPMHLSEEHPRRSKRQIVYQIKKGSNTNCLKPFTILLPLQDPE
ncbi:MAG: hypothetical protein ACRDE5_07570, partial [Ginsengibacter sp.]